MGNARLGGDLEELARVGYLFSGPLSFESSHGASGLFACLHSLHHA